MEKILWQACIDGDLEAVKKLADDPAVDLNWSNVKSGRTPLFCACSFGRTSVVEYLMGNSRVDAMKPDSKGATPFFVACENGHKELVSLLLADPRIDPNKAENDGFTPFSVACENGHKEVVSLLLADPRFDPNNTGCSPFSAA